MKKLTKWSGLLIFILAVLLTACGVPALSPVSPTDVPAAETPVAGQSTLTVAPVDTPVPPTTVPTDLPGLVAAFYRPGSNSLFSPELTAAWQTEVETQGLRWQQAETFGPADLQPGLRLALISPEAVEPGVDLSQLAASAPQTRFVVFNEPGLQPSQNLSVVGPQHYDQQSFLAGSIAAMLTPDWRVGVLSFSDTADGALVRSSFLNGATYFCGLCNPFYGPIVDFPVFIELPASASSSEWQAAADQLIARTVKTIYLPPAVGSAELLNYLDAKGVAVITGYSLIDQPGKNHLVSIIPDQQALFDLPTKVMDSETGSQIELPLALAQIGEKFGLGRQRLALQILADLQGGFIDTGVK